MCACMLACVAARLSEASVDMLNLCNENLVTEDVGFSLMCVARG